MLWRTHIRISEEVLRRLGIFLPREVYLRFKEGVLAPDKWGDFPHHYGKSDAITNYILKARQFYLQNNREDAYYCLGVALHYIQDSYTSVESYQSDYIGREIHQNWERYTDESAFVDFENLEQMINYSLVDKDFQRRICLDIADSLSKGADGRDNTFYLATLSGQVKSTHSAKPKVDLNLGLRASYVIAKSVLSPTNNQQVDLALKQSLDYHEKLLNQAEISNSKEIIQTAKEIESLRNKRINNSGIITRLKNSLLSLRIEIKNMQLTSKYKGYVKKEHLLEIQDRYREATANIINPHLGWYIFEKPELSLEIVRKELVPLREVYREFAVNAETVRTLVKSKGQSTHFIGKQEIINRQVLNQILA